MDLLNDVVRRLSAATSMSPVLYLCPESEINASAGHYDAHIPKLFVNVGLLRHVGEDEGMLGAVVSHEFAHLLLEHTASGKTVADAIRTESLLEIEKALNRGASGASAIRSADAMGDARWARFRRDVEREADDKGNGFAISAGFDPSGPRRFAEGMISIYGDGASYLNNHPRLGERANYSRYIELNETFRSRAEASVAANDAQKLLRTIDQWVSRVPETGASAFYSGVHHLMVGDTRAATSEKLEDAVSLFDGEGMLRLSEQEVRDPTSDTKNAMQITGLTKLSQEDQWEAKKATLALCVSLYREGLKLEALYCLQRSSNEDVESFKRITGWSAFLIMPTQVTPSQYGGDFHGAMSSTNQVFLTNCSDTSAELGLKEVRPWKGLREARAVAIFADSDRAWQCNPGTCKCKEIPASWLLRLILAP